MADAWDPMRRQGLRIVDASPSVCQGDACPDCPSGNPCAMIIKMPLQRIGSAAEQESSMIVRG